MSSSEWPMVVKVLILQLIMLAFSCFSIAPVSLSNCNITSLLYNQSSGRLLLIGTTWDSLPVSHILHTPEGTLLIFQIRLHIFDDIYSMLLFPKCMISEWISKCLEDVFQRCAHYRCKCSTATKRKRPENCQDFLSSQTDSETYLKQIVYTHRYCVRPVGSKFEMVRP